MVFLIIQLDVLRKGFGCHRGLVNADFLVSGKSYKEAVIRFLSEHPGISGGEFLIAPYKYCFSLDTNRIKRIRSGGYKFPYMRMKG